MNDQQTAFPAEVCDALGNYVYRLIDPRTEWGRSSHLAFQTGLNGASFSGLQAAFHFIMFQTSNFQPLIRLRISASPKHFFPRSSLK